MSLAAVYGSTSASISDRNKWYGGCSVSMGSAAPNASICSTSKFDTPTCRILPSAASLPSSSAVSSNGVAGSGQCTWYRST